LRVYLRDDDEIRAEIVDDVVTRMLAIDPGTVTVSVTNGAVRLTGTVDRRSTREILVRLASTVSGVTEVIDNLDGSCGLIAATSGNRLGIHARPRSRCAMEIRQVGIDHRDVG